MATSGESGRFHLQQHTNFLVWSMTDLLLTWAMTVGLLVGLNQQLLSSFARGSLVL